LQTSEDGILTYDNPTAEEKRRIIEGLKHFLPPAAVADLLQDRHLIVARGKRLEVFLLSPPLWRLYRMVRAHRHPYFVGLYLGELRGKSFEPSLHILHHLANVVKEEAKITLTRKGEQRFLYGHSLNRDHLMSVPTTSWRRQPVLVVNTRGEGLGYGYLARSKGKNILKNRVDLGWYLRRGG